jgi:hypothetical protein
MPYQAREKLAIAAERPWNKHGVACDHGAGGRIIPCSDERQSTAVAASWTGTLRCAAVQSHRVHLGSHEASHSRPAAVNPKRHSAGVAPHSSSRLREDLTDPGAGRAVAVGGSHVQRPARSVARSCQPRYWQHPPTRRRPFATTDCAGVQQQEHKSS